jgi:hypothetical protein
VSGGRVAVPVARAKERRLGLDTFTVPKKGATGRPYQPCRHVEPLHARLSIIKPLGGSRSLG